MLATITGFLGVFKAVLNNRIALIGIGIAIVCWLLYSGYSDLKNEISVRDDSIKTLNKTIDDKNAELAKAYRDVFDKELLIELRDENIANLNNAIEENNKVIEQFAVDNSSLEKTIEDLKKDETSKKFLKPVTNKCNEFESIKGIKYEDL